MGGGSCVLEFNNEKSERRSKYYCSKYISIKVRELYISDYYWSHHIIMFRSVFSTLYSLLSPAEQNVNSLSLLSPPGYCLFTQPLYSLIIYLQTESSKYNSISSCLPLMLACNNRNYENYHNEYCTLSCESFLLFVSF